MHETTGMGLRHAVALLAAMVVAATLFRRFGLGAVLVCVDKPEVADRIVELVRAAFPLIKLFVRAFDRGHSLRLVEAGVEYQLRETFESALVFGHQVLIDLGFSDEEARATIEDVRRRDEERFTLQLSGGLQAGRSLMRGNIATPRPAPFVKPRREGQALNEQAAEALEDGEPREREAASQTYRYASSLA